MHVYNSGWFLKITFVNYMYFKQCHIIEILCDVSTIETFLTEILCTEITYFITLRMIMTIGFDMYVLCVLFILKITPHIINPLIRRKAYTFSIKRVSF